jgi:peptidoglycan hydrolase-like protein with peptidoglycan-binding domain
MQSGKILRITSTLFLTFFVASAVPALAIPRSHRGPTSPSLFGKRSKTAKPSSQRAIAPERATEIQHALIKSGYMTGTPSGTWDASTEAAMEKFQADNGWQTKLIPDSRAIIKLGLGPNPAASAAESTGAGVTLPAANTEQRASGNQ